VFVRVTALLGLASLLALPSCGAIAPRAEASPSSPSAARSANGVSVAPRGSVRFVYVVSADREERRDFREAVARAARELQRFYASQLDGWTFALTPAVVDVLHSDKPARWFTENARAGAREGWGFSNTVAEVRRLVGEETWRRHVWMLYSDGPGTFGRGGGGVAYLPEDDLLGLVGEHPTQKSVGRWIAGAGHELGHAFGLPHPPKGAEPPNAIMGAGFYHCWPERCELTPEDRRILARSAYFAPGPGAGARLIERRWYRGGVFLRLEDQAGRRYWEERKDDAGFAARFEELEVTPERILARDASRGLTLELPRGDGQSRVSRDGGSTWAPLYEVEAAPARPR